MTHSPTAVGAALLQVHFAAHGNEGAEKETFYGYYREDENDPFTLHKFVYSGSHRNKANTREISSDGWAILQTRETPNSPWVDKDYVVIKGQMTDENGKIHYIYKKNNEGQDVQFKRTYFENGKRKNRIIGHPPWYNVHDMSRNLNEEFNKPAVGKAEMFSDKNYRPLEPLPAEYIKMDGITGINTPEELEQVHMRVLDPVTKDILRRGSYLLIARPSGNVEGYAWGIVTFVNTRLDLRLGGFRCLAKVIFFDYDETNQVEIQSPHSVLLYFDPEDTPHIFLTTASEERTRNFYRCEAMMFDNDATLAREARVNAILDA